MLNSHNCKKTRWRKKLAVGIFTLCAAISVNAKGIQNWKQLLSQPKCNEGGGFLLWDSQRCLFDTAAVYIDGHAVSVERGDTKVLRRKNALHDSIGDRFLETYRAKNIRVLIQIELLPARCHYADEQCTYRNMRARIRVERVEKPTQIYDAVGYSGS